MGFSLRCILCGGEDVVSLDLDDCKTFRCSHCGDTFDVADVTNHIAEWQAVLEWIKHPRAEVKAS